MRTILLASVCVFLVLSLSGCKGSGSAGGAFSGSSFADAGSILGGGSSPISGGVTNPEPASTLLLGGGLAAYAFLKRKKLR